MYRSMIVPIIAVLAMGAQLAFGVTIGEELQSELVNAITVVVGVGASLYGVFKSHDKPKKK